MKMRIVLTGAILLVLACFNFSYAASLGPIRPLGHMKASIGLEEDFVFSRPLKAKVDITGAKIKNSNSNSLLLALGITDYVNVYTRLGGTNLSENLKWSGGAQETIDYQYGFLWGVGANASYTFKNNFGVGLDVQFDMTSSKPKKISGTNSPAFAEGGKPTVKTYETQIAPYLTYDIKVKDNLSFMPYLGGYYSFYNIYKGVAFVDSTGPGQYTTEDEKIRNKNKLGVLAGCEILFAKQLSLKIEGRFLAETAISTSLNYRF
jgi:hypothetical protein